MGEIRRSYQDEMENLETLMAKIKQIYKLHTSIPVKELREILSHDLWLKAKQCLKWGLTDEIKGWLKKHIS